MLVNTVMLLATARYETHHMVPLNISCLRQHGESILQHCSSTGAIVKLHVLRGSCDVELYIVYKRMCFATPQYIRYHYIIHRV